jgi:hypothetical protein
MQFAEPLGQCPGGFCFLQQQHFFALRGCGRDFLYACGAVVEIADAI